MQKVKSTFSLILFMFLICAFSSGQDAHFSQFYANPLYLGPSYAGSTKGTRLNLNYRNQFPVYKIYSTYSFSIDHYFHKFQSGIGLLVFRDRAGQGKLGTTNVCLQYAYSIHLNKSWRLRPGVSFIYAQRSVDIDALLFPDELGRGGSGSSIRFDNTNNRREAFDFSTSALMHNDKVWFGMSVDHIMRPKLGFLYEDFRVPIKLSVYGGTHFVRRGRLIRTLSETISPSFYYYQQGDVRQMVFGGYWYRDPIVFGVWIRGMFLEFVDNPNRSNSKQFTLFNRDAAIFSAGYRDDKYTFIYSFDFTISNILIRAGGSHEISLSYKFNQEWEKLRRPRKRAIPCPTF